MCWSGACFEATPFVPENAESPGYCRDDPGQLGCPCETDRSCQVGLFCVNGECQRLEDETSGTDPNSHAETSPTTPSNTSTATATRNNETGDSGIEDTSSEDSNGENEASDGEETEDEASSTTATDSDSDADADAETGPSSEDAGENCLPFSTQCFSSTHLQTCNMEGSWDPPVACVEQACVNDQCSGECFPQSTKCLDAAHMQGCSDQGKWEAPQLCVDQTCIGSHCVGECAQGQRRCQGDQALQCSSAGLWTTQATCDGPNEVCEKGECIVTCEPWVRQFGTSELDFASDIVIDGQGHLYIVGQTYGALDGNTHAGGSDVFLTRYRADGSKQWTRQWGTEENDSGEGIAIDDQGNLYIVGMTNGALDGNTHAGGYDVFLAKYRADGTKQWTRQIGSKVTDSGAGIAVDDQGNLYILGSTEEALDGNTHAGSSDVFLAKYRVDGTKQWTRQMGTEEYDTGEGIAIDDQGNLYIVGDTYGAWDGNAYAGRSDAFVAKYRLDGSQQWARQLGTKKHDYASEVAIDEKGDVYFVGSTEGTVAGNSSTGESDVFVVKYSAQGSQQWTRQFGSGNGDGGSGIVSDGTGHVLISGNTGGALDGNPSAGDTDFFVAKWTTSGERIWIQQLGTNNRDISGPIMVDRMGHAYVPGYTQGTFEGHSSAGENDAVIAHICSDPPQTRR